MSSDSSDSKEQLSVKRESPNKQKENFVENVLDDIMGEDLNFEDFDDDVDQKHLQTEKMGKLVNKNTQQRKMDEKISQKEVKQTKTTSNSSVQDKESSSQKRSLTSLENDKTVKIKDDQESSATQTKDKEAQENDAKEEQEKQSTKVDNKLSQSSRAAISSKQKPTRYFIIKSNNFEHLEISMQKSIWSTQPHNEQKLNEAFETSEVILIFSINNSRHFQGYCKMASKIGRETTNIWNQPSGHLSHNHHQSHHGHQESPWGGVFKVEWLARFNLPFGDTLHLRNPWNENKPVKISRDGQELPADIGRELCKLLDQGPVVDKKRKTSSSSEQHESKKPKYDIDVSNNNNNNDGRSSTANQREGESPTSRSRSKHSSRRSRSKSPRRSKSPKRGRSRSPRDRSSRPHRSQTEKYDHVRYRRSKSRSRSRSPTSRKSRSSMDLLNMTYEDYLSAVNDKYRWSSNHPSHQSHFPGFLPGFSEVDYMNYMAWVAKQQSGADMYSYQNSRRRK